ncbi:rhodanese-like domain-containing protein [Aridibaculum aurantiacum]|uniref:rhodanese-like domain-containing protein n=1 Tax=Aridibaculum aurantiacum TaxID=2810307 RepID=UPI001A970F74|nr:rhodanese-like domain-containing protein [Aridibaculum aurantiacum]
MKKWIIIPAVVLAAFLAVGYTWFRQQQHSGKVEEKAFDVILQNLLQHQVNELSVQQLDSNYARYIILDSRTQAEFEVSHLPGAIWIGTEKDEQIKQVQRLPIDQPVVVYCSIGMRSEKAAMHLQETGFANVSNLYGGIFEWINQQKSLVNAKGATKDIHGYNLVWAKWIRNGEVIL